MAIRKPADPASVRSPRIRQDPPADLTPRVPAKAPHAPGVTKNEQGEAARTSPTGGRFVAARDDVPVENLVKAAPLAGGTSAQAVQLGQLGQLDPAAGRASAPERSAEQRLLLLTGRAEAPAASPPPKPAVLARAVENALGEVAQHLSAAEVAAVLGAPSWADAIRDLGAPACREDPAHQPHWLLAAQLSKWMGSFGYANAPLKDVAKSFLATRPDVAQRFPYLDGKLIAALQQAYAFMPQWSSSPAAVKTMDAWDFVAGSAPDPWEARLETALSALAEVPLTMKLTGAMADKLVDKAPFREANVVMVQHMLGQANPLVDAMVRAGMDVTRAEYVGIPYQKNPAVKTTLEQGHGVKVTVPEVGNIDDMWRVITEAVDRAYERHRENGQPILVMDDGGYASKYIADKYKGQEHLFRVVEQTTRGLTEISKIPEINFPIVDVAGSYGKRFESAQVGDAVKMAVRRVLDAVTTTPTRKDVLIVGAGKVGEGVADSFAGDGARISIFDPFITPARKKELEKKGYTVLTDKAKALDKKFLVVGCSGHRSIDMADFAQMSSPVFLASASSKRVEIDTIGLGELARDKEGQLRKILAAKVNEQETWHYFLKDGRIVTAMADGLPVNFQAVNSIAPELIDHTMALKLLGAAQSMTSTAKGLDLLEPTTQFWLQAQMEGLVTERRSADDIALTAGEHTFFGSRADWQRIATSPATPPEVLHDLFALLADPRHGGNPMDPLALSLLESRHELPDKTIDLVLELQLLPWAGHLLKNEALTDAQEDRLLDWLEKSFWNAAGRETQPVEQYTPIAVAGSEQTGWQYLQADVVEVEGRRHLAHRLTTVRDAVVHQASDLLFAHPRAPQYLRDVFLQKTYAIAQDGLASTVLRVTSPQWKPEELDKLFDECANAAWSRIGRSSKPVYANYAYDLVEAFRDHPSASAGLIARAEAALQQIQQRAEERGTTLRGRAGWTMSPLGIPLPDYT